jgi:hypothetical protein
MAVVTRQKSTARRLVSRMPDIFAFPSGMHRGVRGVVPPGANCAVLAVLEDTYQMVVNSDATVTLRLADTGGLTDTTVIVA